MARIRSINPDALKSEKLAAVGAEAERCYWRLQTNCDDEGRAEDDPVILAAYLFPRVDEFTGAVVDEWLAELASVGLVLRYEIGGRRYLQVMRWHDYQRPNKPTPSKLPSAPEDSSSATARVPPGKGVGDGEGEGSAPAGRDAHPYEDEFAAWYESYPRHIDRKNALVQYRARRREGIEPDRLNVARDNYAVTVVGTAKEFVKYPATFLAKDGPWSEYEHGAPDGVGTSKVPLARPVPEPARSALGRGLDAPHLHELDDHGNAVPA